MSGPDAQAARVDRARLRDQLRAAERRLARPSQHLVAAFDAYRASHGTQTDAVIKNLKKLRHTAAQEVKTLKRLEVST
ncbi:MAG: hypothetical protein ACRDL8_07430, partial [Solirubrobacteraceae bacterium]